MRKGLLLVLPALALAGGVAWHFRASFAGWLDGVTGGVSLGVRQSPQPDPGTYAVLAADLERWRRNLATRHRAAANRAERDAVERDARILLELALPEMMRCWLGTPWDFNGTAAKPGAGRIACGYFVSTVLVDAGFRVDRYRLAQQPSGNILRSFLAKEGCTLTVGKPYDAFAAEAKRLQHGIYLIGLDTHVAFLVVDARGFRFIHSSGSRPWCVVDESPEEADVLRRSNWRMLGNLTADSAVLRRWLAGDSFAVRGT